MQNQLFKEKQSSLDQFCQNAENVQVLDAKQGQKIQAGRAIDLVVFWDPNKEEGQESEEG